MKSLLILALISAPAFAAPKAKPATFKQLKDDVNNAYAMLENADGCKFDFKVTRNGLTASVKTDKGAAAYLDVSEDDKITVTSGDGAEGSADVTYVVKGEGVIEIVHAEDAYDSVILKDRNGKSLTCEIDY
ncbi:MAG: hypothetical protein ACXVB9_03155 [Bdellovibrionota bacterium]